MKKVATILLLLCLIPHAFAADTIVTKKNRKYHGKVIKIIDKGFVVRTVEGSIIVIPKENISKIFRGNKVLDLEEGMSYYLEVRRPFLPFIVLSIATGAYAVKKFQDYQNERERVKNSTLGDLVDTSDKSKTHLAWCIASGLFSLGSFYVAIRPMEVKVPIGRINVSTTSNGITVALHF